MGVGAGITFKPFLDKDYTLTGSYSYAKFDLDNAESEYRTGFNTPENKITVGLSNRKLTENLGFSVNFRWQEGFLWESDFGSWDVPEFGVIDAQVSYTRFSYEDNHKAWSAKYRRWRLSHKFRRSLCRTTVLCVSDI